MYSPAAVEAIMTRSVRPPMDEDSIDEEKVTTCGLSRFVLSCEVNVCIACNDALVADIFVIVLCVIYDRRDEG